ncbi:MAG TPA: IS1595 family transposase [Gammaproteobacteria bacterium]|jgi:transposase-like protein
MNRENKVQNRSTKGDTTTRNLPRACADEGYAVDFMEAQRWEGRPGCPHCGDMDVYQMTDSKTGKRQANYRWRCRGCKEQFTVRTGTVFEGSKIELRHWCYAYWRACSSKKGVSALEIHRQTGVSYKSALFMLHRIRFGMTDSATPPLTGTVEVDETYVGGKPRYRSNKPGPKGKKIAVMALVQRDGHVKTQVLATVTAQTVRQVIKESLHPEARLMTDESKLYTRPGREQTGGHETVNHSRHEYARGDVTTNTVEGFFSIVKRGLNGIYHSVSKEHLHRYMAEFEFRYNRRSMEDGERIRSAIQLSEGKRLLYKEPLGA